MAKKKSNVKNNSSKNLGIEKALIDNFVSLQKVMTNMAVKFDSLTTQISKLLELFEISAKELAEKGYSLEDKKVVEKLDSLLEQNKIIAKGIALLHERGVTFDSKSQSSFQSTSEVKKPVIFQNTNESKQIPPTETFTEKSSRIKESGV